MYIGLRDVDEGERRILQKRNIKAFTMFHVDKYGIAKVRSFRKLDNRQDNSFSGSHFFFPLPHCRLWKWLWTIWVNARFTCRMTLTLVILVCLEQVLIGKRFQLQQVNALLTSQIVLVSPAVIAPATGTAVRGGLTFREAHYIAEAAAETNRLGSMDMVEVNPIIPEEDLVRSELNCPVFKKKFFFRRGPSTTLGLYPFSVQELSKQKQKERDETVDMGLNLIASAMGKVIM